MADTDSLKPFVPPPYPTIPGGETRYFIEADKRISQSITSIIQAMKRLEARIEALEP